MAPPRAVSKAVVQAASCVFQFSVQNGHVFGVMVDCDVCFRDGENGRRVNVNKVLGDCFSQHL